MKKKQPMYAVCAENYLLSKQDGETSIYDTTTGKFIVEVGSLFFDDEIRAIWRRAVDKRRKERPSAADRQTQVH